MKWILKELTSLDKKPSNLEYDLNSILLKPTKEKLINLWESITVYLKEEKHAWTDKPKLLLK